MLLTIQLFDQFGSEVNEARSQGVNHMVIYA